MAAEGPGCRAAPVASSDFATRSGVAACADGRADFVNRRWCEYTGLGFDEACGHGWHAAVHPDDRPDFLARWRSILESGGQGEVEARLRRFDGAYFWFLLRANPVVDALGKVVGWCGVGTDLDDRRWAETLLAGEKRLLEMVAQSLPLARVLEALCNFVEDTAPSCLCSILSIDPDGVRFRPRRRPQPSNQLTTRSSTALLWTTTMGRAAWPRI